MVVSSRLLVVETCHGKSLLSPFAKSTIGSRFVKSADSIGANIAEESEKGSSLDNKRFAKIARGSLFETKHWLRRAVKKNR